MNCSKLKEDALIKNVCSDEYTETRAEFMEAPSKELNIQMQKRYEYSKESIASLDDYQYGVQDHIDTNSDLLLAQLLQLEFDKEYNEKLRNEEKKVNGNSKICVSFNNYRINEDLNSCFENTINDCEDDKDENVWECEFKDSLTIFPKCGYKYDGTHITTKHDLILNNRKNVSRVMKFPLIIKIGDDKSFDMKINNKKRSKRIHDKFEKSTVNLALDPATRIMLFKLLDHSFLTQITGIVSTGKESVVLHAFGGKEQNSEYAIKIYKTALNEFKNRREYMQNQNKSKHNPSQFNSWKAIQQWAGKEKNNLIKMAKAGISCPDVFLLRKHILIMSFLGENQQAASKLKDICLNCDEWKIVYNDVIKNMIKLYQVCHLIHADLSEYNILWHKNSIFFIDVSQSVQSNHPSGMKLLHRDCQNINKHKGIFSHTSEELFEKITGLSLFGDVASINIQLQLYCKQMQHQNINEFKI